MTVYRVGPDGATVFDEDGTPLLWLRPGSRVVAGSTELAGTPAAEHHDTQQKRRKGYEDKALRATPPRQPDARLRNPMAGSG